MRPSEVQIDTHLEDTSQRKAWITFLVFLTLALFLHFAFFFTRLQWITPHLATRTEIQEISPKKLDAIRKKWQEKSLLLNKDQTQPREEKVP